MKMNNYGCGEVLSSGLSKSKKVKYTDIAVCSLTCHTITGTHMLYRIQSYSP